MQVCLYADDSTLYTSATTLSDMTATLNKELHLVSEWMARNNLVLNISKNKINCIWDKSFTKPELNLVNLHGQNLLIQQWLNWGEVCS
jgi:hypothetical protein